MEWLGTAFSSLPLPWLITALSNLGWGWVCFKLWQRSNDLADKRVEDAKDYVGKYAEISLKCNDMLQTLISFLRK